MEDVDEAFLGILEHSLAAACATRKCITKRGTQAHFHAHDFTPAALNSSSHNSLQRVNQKYKQKGANEQSVLADTTNRMKASALIN